jgi:hypothetical protein
MLRHALSPLLPYARKSLEIAQEVFTFAVLQGVLGLFGGLPTG